ncbi:DNA-binding protein [Lindgomyces ingoldianus]|uniref:DNA-binding protein n=1 Tax=Lindgomyces ingoldianus TaxID=673940 RepID=A0ACB6QYS0_9PLEO|nr:DNA-binding protein [Lindgomyces ingoldianus]KAF2472066.1 DNA-binding protein [Lindgomyces ingoldianus]
MTIPTYLTTLSHFTNFLTAYIHTLLYLRHLYPRPTFLTSRFHNTSVYQSRHPAVCEWITDAVSAIRTELLAGTVAKIAVVIYWYGIADDGTGAGGTGTGGAGTVGGGGEGNPKVLERFMLDVSSFPVVGKGERNMEIGWEGALASNEDQDSDQEQELDMEGAGASRKGKEKQREKLKAKALDVDVDVDMSEQFRAALITLTTRCSQLKPLPKNCSFNISLELKDEADIDPPVGHPQPWIPVQPSLQKTGRKHVQAEDQTDERGREEGQDLGGVRTTPIRTVEAGVFRFETWIEEGKAKFELERAPKIGLASSGG